MPAGDVPALAAALEDLATTESGRLADMGAAGRDRVRERHDVDTEALKLAALIAATPPRPAPKPRRDTVRAGALTADADHAAH